MKHLKVLLVIFVGAVGSMFAIYAQSYFSPDITSWSCSSFGQGDPNIIIWCDYCGDRDSFKARREW
jgi:hypothetical protein